MDYVPRLLMRALVVACSVLSAQGQPRAPQAPLRISADYARFRYDEKDMYIEFYYSFPQRALTYVAEAAGYKAGVEITISVLKKDSVAFADRMLVPHVVQDSAAAAMNLISMSNARLPEGNYTLKILAKDNNDKSRVDSLIMQMPVKILPADKVALSDIEFASMVKKGKQGSLFYKNTLDVIPNADGLYSNEQQCFYYAEAYNLLAGEDKSDLTIKMAVLNSIGKEVISRERLRKRSAESTVLVDNFDVSNLRSGTYTLSLVVLDSTKKMLAGSAKKFFVYNSVLGVDSSLMRLDPAIALSAFSTMDEPDLDREFKWSKWEAKEDERDQYDELKGVVAKRKFLTDFWTKRPAGARDQYLARVAFANTSFRVLGMDGYKTDRGRVHIIYGTPDDIDRHPNESGTRPYEIWSFNNIQGGVIFVFAMRQNGGDYELVHSTHRNELRDDNWQRFIQTN